MYVQVLIDWILIAEGIWLYMAYIMHLNLEYTPCQAVCTIGLQPPLFVLLYLRIIETEKRIQFARNMKRCYEI